VQCESTERVDSRTSGARPRPPVEESSLGRLLR
jgi:hypothetical protein